MKKFGVGVIGLGMGINVLPINRVVGSLLEVRGICDIDEGKLRECAENFGISFVTRDYHELIARQDIDIVAIYTPDHLHGQQAIEALEVGKHVICTKPMVTSLKEVEKICALVREKKLKFLVGQTMRYEPQFVSVKTLFDEGQLGEVIFAEAHYVHDMRPVFLMTPWRLKAPQDVMYGGVCHPVDVLRWFLGDVEEVFALGNRGNLTPEYPLLGNFLLTLKFKNGTMARILGAYDIVHPPMPMMGLSIFGTKGSAIADFTDKEGGRVKVIFDKFEVKSPWEVSFPPETEGAFGHGRTVLRYLKHFEECLVEDKTPVPDCFEGAKSIAVCHAAYESIREGKPVKVKNEF